jgi:hypothetical protein
MMEKIHFYVGIDTTQESDFKSFVYMLNEDTDEKFHVELINEYDDPEGYYTYTIRGSWEAYKCFLDRADFVKSLNHYEE